ncbi:hypothetical protein RN001_007609 [Aquatica leii]|uniref:Uncharacterized protein n=1 Tax=Aquatica leii TaxID=1421715 RepID=A0AAN7SNY5_9COLE|nr:hypothetical protein RN001_007609 [Aquatica leii]
MGEKLTETFMQLFCEKNSDKTKYLRLKGKELQQRIRTRLRNSDMIKVAEFLLKNEIIVKLDVSYNDIGDRGIELLTTGYLSRCNSLEHLNLMGCNITAEGIQFLVDCSDTLKLCSLRLTGNKFGFKGGVLVSELLGNSTTLLQLDVGDTDQTAANVQYFMGVMRKDIGTKNSLQIFDFSRVIPMSKNYQYEPYHLADSIGEMIKVNDTLLELHIQKNQLDGHDVEYLLIGLRKNVTLLFLDLGYNRIGEHGIELISKWLAAKPNLLALNVAANGIGNIGARALSFGMPFSKVRLLDISNNKIGTTGMIDILNTIKKPYMLRYFFFWGNTLEHPTNTIIQRMLRSTVLVQEQIDVKLYTVDEVIYSAYYPSNHYKHRYYCVMDTGCPVELKIKRNKIVLDSTKPKALLNLQYYDRFPFDGHLIISLKPTRPKQTKRVVRRKETSKILTSTPVKDALERQEEDRKKIVKPKPRTELQTNKKIKIVKSKPNRKEMEASTSKIQDESSEENDSASDVDCLYCVSKYSASRGGEGWIQCQGYRNWAHEECAGIDDFEDKFLCLICNN